MKKLNVFMIVQWIVFLPLMLPIAVVTGALDGIKKIFIQATNDVLDNETELY